MAATLPAESALSKAKDSGRPPERRHNAPWGDALFAVLAHSAAWLTLAILAGIIGSLVVGAMPAMREFGISFLWHSEWDPVQDHYGGLAMIYGTLATSFIALLIAVPVSFGIALFLTEMSPGLAQASAGRGHRTSRRRAVHRLRHVGPDRVRPHPGDVCRAVRCKASSATFPCWVRCSRGRRWASASCAPGIILAIMIIPFIASVMRDVFEVTPPMLKESAYGLGSTTWEVVYRVVLPFTKTGVIGGIMLGLGRALGETMAVTFVIGNQSQLSRS